MNEAALERRRHGAHIATPHIKAVIAETGPIAFAAHEVQVFTMLPEGTSPKGRFRGHGLGSRAMQAIRTWSTPQPALLIVTGRFAGI
jgi:hypothetical protein